MKKSCHIIGAGKVGRTFAALLSKNANWKLSHIVSRSLPQGAYGAQIIRTINSLPPAEVIFITVPDNAIETAAQTLAASSQFRAGTAVIHMSGAKTVAVLQSITAKGGAAGSLHPVFAFADAEHAAANLKGSQCAIETDNERAEPILLALANDLGLQPFHMPSEYKARYHAALSAASNFSVALAAYAQNLLQPLNLPETQSRQLIGGLMQQSIENLALMTAQNALTGPIIRGDTATVTAHLATLNETERQHYCAWAEQTLKLAQPRLTQTAVEKLRELLNTK